MLGQSKQQPLFKPLPGTGQPSAVGGNVGGGVVGGAVGGELVGAKVGGCGVGGSVGGSGVGGSVGGDGVGAKGAPPAPGKMTSSDHTRT